MVGRKRAGVECSGAHQRWPQELGDHQAAAQARVASLRSASRARGTTVILSLHVCCATHLDKIMISIQRAQATMRACKRC